MAEARETLILIYYSTENKEVYINPYVDSKILMQGGVFIDIDGKQYIVKYYTNVYNIAFAVEE